MTKLKIKKDDEEITLVDEKDIENALDNKSDNTHGHGNLQNDGRVGTSNNASKNVVTDGSGKITTEAKPSIPVASSTVPLADTVSGSVGEGTTWAKADHTHKKSGIYAEANHTHNLNLNNLNIYADGQGGTNLIEGTQYFVGTKLNNGVASGMYQGCLCRRVNNTSGTNYLDIIYDIPDGTFKHGEKYTISFWAKGTGNIFLYNYGNDKSIKTKPINCTSGGTNPNISAYHDGKIKFVLTSDWKRYFVTWELNPTSDSTNDASAHKLLILRTDKNTDAYWAGVMYERGEIPHDWSPSPKDIPRENITASSTSIADLNDYKKAGFYYNGNNNEANYIIHCPNSDGTNTPYTNNHSFFLLVEDWGSNNYSVKQTLTYYDDDTIYTRRYVNGNWGTWKKTLNSSNYSTYALSNANGAVLNANIGNNQVNNAKLSDNAVSTSKIQDGAITNAKIASITDNKLTYDSNVYNGLSPIDMSMIDTSNANRLAFMPVANIQVKVSTNGGSTWSDYPSITNDMKLKMVSKAPDETSNLYSGGTTSASANNQIRIILDAGEITSSKNSDVYCSDGKKLMIAITANNASAPKVTVDMASYANPTSWVNAKTYDVGGWWGWNSIPFPYIFGGYQGQQTDSGHYRYIRLTFTHTGGSGNPIVKAIRLYTPISYISPSNYAKDGHIYTYDTNQNVTFPAKIIKNGGTSSQFLKANGSVFDISTHNQGGTNLLQGTQNFNGARGILQRYAIGTYRNLEYVLVNNSNETSYTDISFPIPANTFDYGEKYTLSFWINGSGEIKVYNFGNTNCVKTKVINCTSGGTSVNAYGDGSCTFTLDNSGWKRYFVTWELNPTASSSNDLNVDKYIVLRTMAGTTARFAGVMYERGEIPHDWSPSPLDNSKFDFSKIKGTDNTVGYIKALKLKITNAYQDRPIAIEFYQRDRMRRSIVNINFSSSSNQDPGLASITHSESKTFTNNANIEFYLYKESTSTWSLIVSKGHGQKYGELKIKINNPNEGIEITKLDTHLVSLPSNTTNNPLKTSSCIDNTTPCTVTYTDGRTDTINLVTR